MERKERPIIFSAESVKAILEGRKTMTRRIAPKFAENATAVRWRGIHGGDSWQNIYGKDKNLIEYVNIKCPYGVVGDLLYVKETYLNHALEGYEPVYLYRADGENKPTDRAWKSPRFMPKAAARIWLEITNIRVERLQKISHDDAIAEGIDLTNSSSKMIAVERFERLWKQINGADSWDKNYWVWVIEFKSNGR